MTTHSAAHTPTDEPTVHRLGGVPDLINSLPAQFGFAVTESLVAITTIGPRKRLGVSGRIDLPPPGDHHAKRDVVSRIVAPLERHGGDGIIVLALSSDPLWAEEVVLSVVDAVSLPVVMAAWATDDRFWEHGFSPAEGEPFAADPAHEVVVSAVARGRRVLKDRTDLAADVRPPTAEDANRIVELERLLTDDTNDLDPCRGRTERRRRVRRGRALLRDLRQGKDVAPEDLVRLARWTDDLPVRDAWWTDVDGGNAEELWSAWATVARANRGPHRRGPLALAAFAAWQAGDGARALVAVEAALAEDPEYSLARLIEQILDHGIHPQWWGTRRKLIMGHMRP